LTQDFCAACHRGASEFASLKGMGVNNVRFQPYRIFNSKCYSDDRRISCAACHDPHEPLNTDAAFYDSKCLACHAAGAKPARAAPKPDAQDSAPACRAGTKNCASCHMPKVELSGAHFKFTDHYIRVVRPNEPYQD
jgi:cytochrome c peroxidase